MFCTSLYRRNLQSTEITTIYSNDQREISGLEYQHLVVHTGLVRLSDLSLL